MYYLELWYSKVSRRCKNAKKTLNSQSQNRTDIEISDVYKIHFEENQKEKNHVKKTMNSQSQNRTDIEISDVYKIQFHLCRMDYKNPTSPCGLNWLAWLLSLKPEWFSEWFSTVFCYGSKVHKLDHTITSQNRRGGKEGNGTLGLYKMFLFHLKYAVE